jgi:hypothetical protein
VEKYSDPAFPAAEYAESDAANLAAALRRWGGYASVDLLTKPSARTILDAAGETVRPLLPGDVFFFYFAGHSVWTGQRAMLVGRDAIARRVSALQDVVPLDLLLAETAAPGVARFFLIDAGRARATVTGIRPGLPAEVADAVMGSETGGGPPLTLYVFGGSGEANGVLPDRRQGAMTAALLEEMQEAVREGYSLIVDEARCELLGRRLKAFGSREDLYVRRRGNSIELFSPDGSLSPTVFPRREVGGVGGGGRTGKEPPVAETPWFRVAADYRDRIACQISRRAACLYGVEVEGMDGAALFEQGAARGLEWRGGVPLAALEWLPLIAMGRRAEIETCLRSGAVDTGQEELPYLLRLFYVDNDRDRAAYEADKIHHKALYIEPAILLATGFRDMDAGRRYLAEASAWPEKEARFLAQCARAWQVVFGDAREASRCLEAAERRALDTQDWEGLAAGAMDFFGDARSAWRHLGRAETLAVCARDWIVAAAGWMRIFGDRRECGRCIQHAERSAVAARDWMACARGRRELLDDFEGAKEALANAEASAREVWEWQDCAERWMHLFNDETGGRRCLVVAEQEARHFGEWRDCAAAWIRLLKDSVEARECLIEAERRAGDAFQWEACATDWADMLHDKERAERCRAQANRLKIGR